MTVDEAPRPPADGYWAVARLLDKADSCWWARRPPSTSERSREGFYEVAVVGADGVTTQWVLWPDQARLIAPFLKANQTVRCQQINARKDTR